MRVLLHGINTKKRINSIHSCLEDMVYDSYGTAKNSVVSFAGSSPWGLCAQSVLINRGYTMSSTFAMLSNISSA
jgi:hypothetical protein